VTPWWAWLVEEILDKRGVEPPLLFWHTLLFVCTLRWVARVHGVGAHGREDVAVHDRDLDWIRMDTWRWRVLCRADGGQDIGI
jgi:hypothetical protein